MFLKFDEARSREQFSILHVKFSDETSYVMFCNGAFFDVLGGMALKHFCGSKSLVVLLIFKACFWQINSSLFLLLLVLSLFVLELETADFVYTQFLEKFSKGHRFLGECLISRLSTLRATNMIL